MQQPIGEFIRQARRQHNFTQTELGGNRFSKSYISAVERNKIPSSPDALHFFAEQLGQPSDYFTALLQEVGNTTQLSVLNASGQLSTSTHLDDTLTLLDILLDSTELYNFPVRYELPTLSSEVIAALPSHKQSRYYFLIGLISQNKGELSAALRAFEYSLALAPDKHRPAILDELGINYYTAKLYQTSLVYHQRALHFLQHNPQSPTAAGLRFKIELHCGDDYRALGAYQQAREHYEQARLSLCAEHDMKTAGLLYVGLGF
jgi:tetratricopeptide (TPR) repeat protein